MNFVGEEKFGWLPSKNKVADENFHFYRFKIILDRPNCFGWVQIVLVGSKSFWSGPKHFGQVQIRLFCSNFYNLDQSEIILTWTIQIGPIQNNWYSTKMIWTVQNHFGPIEGQGIKFVQVWWPLDQTSRSKLTMKIQKELMYMWRSLSNPHLPWLCKLHKMQSWLEIPHRTSWGKCLDTEINIYFRARHFSGSKSTMQSCVKEKKPQGVL